MQHKLSNAEFAKVIFSKKETQAVCYAAGFRQSPESSDANWGGFTAQPEEISDFSFNAYFSNASFVPNATARNLKNFKALHVLVADDIKDAPIAPTYRIETSKGNYQIGFKLKTPIENVELANRLVKSIAYAGLGADRSGNNAIRWTRLPYGSNTKYTPAFEHKLESWNPQLEYTLDELIDGLGLDRHFILEGSKAKATSDYLNAFKEAFSEGDFADHMKDVITQENIHGSALSLAASMIASGAPAHLTNKLIQGLLEINPRPDDQRWSSRHADIPRIVQTAVDKFSPEASSVDLEACSVDYSDLGEQDDTQHPHVVDRLCPEDEVTLGGGHGGAGKSILALNLGIHVALGLPFAGLTTKQTNVVFYSAEDGLPVLRRRLRKLCRAQHIDHKRLEGRLFLLDVSDQDAFLHKGASGYTHKTETAQLKQLASFMKAHDIGFCIIDNASDTFADDEIKRTAVRAFIRSLRSLLARPYKASVLLLAHINKQGARGGSDESEDYSGSTAWHNSARSRFSVTRDLKTDTITLTHRKANLSPLLDAPITFNWVDGVPLVLTQNPDHAAFLAAQKANNAALNREDKKLLLGIIAKRIEQGREVNATEQSAYSTYNTLKDDPSYPKTLGKDRFKQLINEMLDDGALTLKTVWFNRNQKNVFALGSWISSYEEPKEVEK